MQFNNQTKTILQYRKQLLFSIRVCVTHKHDKNTHAAATH